MESQSSHVGPPKISVRLFSLYFLVSPCSSRSLKGQLTLPQSTLRQKLAFLKAPEVGDWACGVSFSDPKDLMNLGLRGGGGVGEEYRHSPRGGWEVLDAAGQGAMIRQQVSVLLCCGFHDNLAQLGGLTEIYFMVILEARHPRLR